MFNTITQLFVTAHFILKSRYLLNDAHCHDISEVCMIKTDVKLII